MEPMILQPVQGARNVSIYPYLRKIDIMSSNSYLLSAQDRSLSSIRVVWKARSIAWKKRS